MATSPTQYLSLYKCPFANEKVRIYYYFYWYCHNPLKSLPSNEVDLSTKMEKDRDKTNKKLKEKFDERGRDGWYLVEMIETQLQKTSQKMY